MFYACWYGAAGKKIVRATGIPVDASLKPGAPRESKASLKKKAATVARLMENADKEGMTLEAAQAALSAIISGNYKLPTVREYAEDYLRTHQNNSKQNDKKAINRLTPRLRPFYPQQNASLLVPFKPERFCRRAPRPVVKHEHGPGSFTSRRCPEYFVQVSLQALTGLPVRNDGAATGVAINGRANLACARGHIGHSLRGAASVFRDFYT